MRVLRCDRSSVGSLIILGRPGSGRLRAAGLQSSQRGIEASDVVLRCSKVGGRSRERAEGAENEGLRKVVDKKRGGQVSVSTLARLAPGRALNAETVAGS